MLPFQTRADEMPSPAKGYKITQIAQNLGDITALAIIKNDIFVLDSKKNRIIRLRDQNQDGSVDVQTVYLVGFTDASHMVANQSDLYISDANGIWKSTVGKSLNTAQVPTNIVPFSVQTHLPLAIGKNHLFAGIWSETFKGIVTVHYETHAVKSFAKLSAKVHALTTSPSGQLWAAVQTSDGTLISHIHPQNNQRSSRKNLGSQTIKNMLLWKDQLLLASTQPDPAVRAYDFAYGELTRQKETLIDGFSNPSLTIGKVDIWGTPSAMAVLNNDDLVFADGKNGALWQVSKAPIETEIATVNLPNPQQETLGEVIPLKSPKLIFGSSISSASTLNHGSAIGKEELLKTGKKKK